ncbi:MAG TPA: phosphoglycerate dehydrogenase [Anaerolineae bacterium]|nr:phosphoglycerate dehydrogenase [Anaerolineae bacterium]
MVEGQVTNRPEEDQPRVLVADRLAEAGLALLRPQVQLDVRTNLSHDELLSVIPEYDALIVRSRTQVTAEVIAAASRLQVVARAGVGVDNIDVEAATRAGVLVVNAPTGNVVAAAEHTIALLTALARRVPQADASVRHGEWQRGRFMGVELRDKRLGCIGLGRVGSLVAERAKGLGMQVVAYDPYISSDYAANLGVELVPLEVVLRTADFITLHLPLTEQTRGLIDARALIKVKRGAYLINCARGGIVDEGALLQALNDERLAGAALDVFSQEPPPADSPLLRHPNVILTPHIGGSTTEAQERVAMDVAEQVLAVLADRPARYAINAPIIPPKEMEFLIPYIDLAERMGRFLAQFAEARIEGVEITTHGQLATYDISYLKAAAIKGLLSDVVEERVNLVNAGVVASQRGLRIVERRTERVERYENLLTLRATTSEGERTIRGSVLYHEPCIVAIDDLWVNFPAAGHLLLTRHHDRPGIIGRIGTLLGNADINISFMHVGRRAPRGEAIMVLGTDEPIPSELFGEIQKISHTYWVLAVDL